MRCSACKTVFLLMLLLTTCLFLSVFMGFMVHREKNDAVRLRRKSTGVNGESLEMFLQLTKTRARQKLFEIGSRVIDKFECSSLFAGNSTSLVEAKRWDPTNSSEPLSRLLAQVLSVVDVLNNGSFHPNREWCRNVSQTLGFPAAPLSREEAQYPLAYTILIHTNFFQSILLLRRLYMPQNLYCIHMDLKVTKEFRRIIQGLVACLPNVFFSKRRRSVYWGHPSTLFAAQDCLDELNSARSPNWKYVQIVGEQDFPLRTNREIVQIFKILNGANDCALQREAKALYEHPFSEWDEKAITNWTEPCHPLRPGKCYAANKQLWKTPPPANLTIYKGWMATSMSREFVNFTVNDSIARELLDWLNDTLAADEKYWPTLIHNPQLGAPGSFPGSCFEHWEAWNKTKPQVSRYQVAQLPGSVCLGRWLGDLCEFGVGDLPSLAKQPHLMAHKLDLANEPAALLCLDELISNRTFREYWVDPTHESHYANLPGVKYEAMRNKPDYICGL